MSRDTLSSMTYENLQPALHLMLLRQCLELMPCNALWLKEPSSNLSGSSIGERLLRLEEEFRLCSVDS